MTDKEKLIDLLWRCVDIDTPFGEIADHLLANGVTFQKWIPVTERLPEKMCQCICRYVFGENMEYPFYQVLWYFVSDENQHFQDEGSMGMKVTHWMPLPEPPKE